MKAFIFTAATALGLMLLPSSGAVAAAAQYKFDLIADTGGPFKGFVDFAINKSGTVAFSAQHGDNIGVFTGRGTGPLTTIRYTGTAGPVAINDDGTVVFTKPINADFSGGGLFTGRGGPVRTIVATGDYSYPTINEQGAIAFRRLASNGGPPTSDALVYIGGKVSQIPGVFSLASGSAMINNRNAVVLGERNAIYSNIQLSQGGAAPALLAESGSAPGAFQSLLPTSLNDAGTIAFLGSKRSETVREDGVYTLSAGTVRTIVSTTTGTPGGYFGYTGDIAINNGGTVAFGALVAADKSGLFTGPNPVANKVVAVGDPLLGSTVTEVVFSRNGLSDSGQLAFRAKLATGKYAIVRATPVSSYGYGR